MMPAAQEPTNELPESERLALRALLTDPDQVLRNHLLVEALPGTQLSPLARAYLVGTVRRLLLTRLDPTDLDSYITRQRNRRRQELDAQILALTAERDALP
jgi:hypothetical protein